MHACGLDRELYSGLAGWRARRRLGRLTEHAGKAMDEETREAIADEDADSAVAVDGSLPDIADLLIRETASLVDRACRVERAPHGAFTAGAEREGHHSHHGHQGHHGIELARPLYGHGHSGSAHQDHHSHHVPDAGQGFTGGGHHHH